ncbi:LacI family DNA-binding transcriptional regulator [Rhizobium sp. AN80A]|uniref:substrate-binding domain-containing protein n=1 Tax=unclassified Rhizobium TaxID=2613769 RepID=UPI0013AF09AE|nr:LacI family DNA-binding transcriptional regulator [Rhizobium sp. AN80A]
MPITAEEERADAFREAAALAGFDVDGCPVLLGEYEPGGLVETLPGYRLASQILDNNIPEVSAIIAGSDILVAGVLQALYERRLRVPDDISLIGYDDSMTRFLSPPLSSIGQPYDAIGRAAIELVEAARQRPVGSVASPTRSVETSLVLRHSVGPHQAVSSARSIPQGMAPNES